MSGELSGKRVLVIGGETLVGRAIVVGLAERGVDVAIASLTNDTKAEFAINSALNELWAMGRKGLALPIDASDADRVRGAVARLEKELGTIDLVVAVMDNERQIAIEALPEGYAQIVTESSPAEALESIVQQVATTTT